MTNCSDMMLAKPFAFIRLDRLHIQDPPGSLSSFLLACNNANLRITVYLCLKSPHMTVNKTIWPCTLKLICIARSTLGDMHHELPSRVVPMLYNVLVPQHISICSKLLTNKFQAMYVCLLHHWSLHPCCIWSWPNLDDWMRCWSPTYCCMQVSQLCLGPLSSGSLCRVTWRGVACTYGDPCQTLICSYFHAMQAHLMMLAVPYRMHHEHHCLSANFGSIRQICRSVAVYMLHVHGHAS